MKEVPRRVVVLGGGVVACEASTWLHGLGAAEVTVVQRGPRLLARSEPFAGELVAEELQDCGVRLYWVAECHGWSAPTRGTPARGVCTAVR